MPRSNRHRVALVVALLLVTASSLLPTPWLGLASDVANIVNVPIAPLAHLGQFVTQTLRPVQSEFDHWPREAQVQFEEIEAERAQFERLYREAQQSILELREQVEQLQLVPVQIDGKPRRRLNAAVTIRTPTDAHGPVKLSAGTRHGVSAQAVAVSGGVDLVGRVSDATTVLSTLVPLTNEACGSLSGVVFPADKPDLPLEQAARIRLKQDGAGGFVGDVDRKADVAVGDPVYLSDSSWPQVAQFLRVGIVHEIQTKDSQPLLKQLIVIPRQTVADLAMVVLLFEDEAMSEGGS